MSEPKDQPRISFSKDKIENHLKGATGITGTSRRMVDPTSEIDADICEGGNINYNASELLFKNLDALGAKLNLNKEINPELDEALIADVVPEVWGEDMLDNLSEEDVIANLDQHLGYNESKDGLVVDENMIERDYAKDAFLRLGEPFYTGPFIVPPSFVVPNNSSPSQSEKDSFCRSCGGQYLATDNFCGSCGYKRT